MKAVIIDEFGGPEMLKIGEWPNPKPGKKDLLVKIVATALNRADTLQRKGLYPPPLGESPILGLEMAGEVVEIGREVSQWKVGDRVCGLLGGGGYAQYACISEDMAMPIPDNLTYEQAAAIPEVFLTAFQALIWLGQLQAGETILIHAGASGVGTAAIQLAKVIGTKIIVTASKTKHELCLQLGAEKAIDYRSEDFQEVIEAYTKGEGINMVLDFLAASYFQKNLNVLGLDGRLVILALMGGTKLEQANIGVILRKRLKIIGSTLRSRSLDYKIRLTKDLQSFAWTHFESGVLHPVIDSTYNWQEVDEAHRYMEANKNKGKIVLRIS